MYSATRFSIDFQLARMQNGIKQRGQHDEQQRNAVHAHVIGDAAAQPVGLLDELEGGRRAVELGPDDERDGEIGQRS